MELLAFILVLFFIFALLGFVANHFFFLVLIALAVWAFFAYRGGRV